MMKILLATMLLFVFTSCNLTKNERELKLQKIDTISKQSNKSNDVITPQKNKLLFDIEGNYVFQEDSESCEMEILLFYSKDQLKYKMKTASRELLDDAILDLNEENNGYYLTLKNIEWSENLGAIDTEEGENQENNEEEILLPQEVQGVLYPNEISIQNSGNAMNYYVKLGDCDSKFIHLVKQ